MDNKLMHRLQRKKVISFPIPSILAMSLFLVASGILVTETSALEIRSLDGNNNNRANPTWGSTNSQLLRTATPDYQDGMAQPSGADRPNVREISNTVVTQKKLIYNRKHASDMVWQWGQFLDHDIDLTGGVSPEESFPIQIPTGDPFFDPRSTGTQEMPLSRSLYDHATGLAPNNPRQQINQITAFIDASGVYGSDPVRAVALRTNDGTGRLKTSPGNLLPFNTQGLPNAGGPADTLFLAGDIRANEQVGLTSLHTLFVREHNRLARKIRHRFPALSGDQIYERARRKVGAMIQVITYKEFLPILLGPDALKPYTGYDSNVNPGIANEFSTAAYRFGHSMLSPKLLRVKKNGKPISEGHLALREAFFAPWRITNERGIGPILRGLARNRAQEVDPYIIDDVRNFLFGPPGSGGFDLACLNLQRGRDHGLPSYNDVRVAYGLSPAVAFADITRNRKLRDRIETAYGTVEKVDPWIGGLAEDHRRASLVGELFHTILVNQFERLRDGDRFFYRNLFPHYQVKQLERTTLAKIIKRNTGIGKEMQKNVFLYPHKVHR